MNLSKAIREQEALKRINAAEAHVRREAGRLKEEFREARAVEVALEIRIAAAETWSGRWWHLLGQLDIVRRRLIEIRSNFRISPYEI